MTPAGTKVRVKTMTPPGHIRAPFYLRGKTGEIERILGRFKNPEQLAYGLPAPEKTLYRVRFSMAELWGDAAENPTDTVDAEIYDHWLEEA
ncbi:Nitrile hydratase subunit beta [Roseovarius sp. THAF9]|uniref:SH3-like domain-containing protein n=1 Tax=Roseovarius sp. THAF9 TaxID=2587847 RepID=UPI0012691321|nr:SH3-like domain-containing protein [Roseovarius sp. THAF9]QFT91704.1 Nitrile hydratase subunit beta [Roseovarius sp. THAF9]